MKRLFALILPLISVIAVGRTVHNGDRLDFTDTRGRLEIYAVANDVLRLDYQPFQQPSGAVPEVHQNLGITGAPGISFTIGIGPGSRRKGRTLVHDAPTDIVAPSGLHAHAPVGDVIGSTVETKGFIATLEANGDVRILSLNGAISLDVRCEPNRLTVDHEPDDNLYGMRGIGLGDNPVESPALGLLRDHGAPVAAGAQGDGGAPMAYSTQWGLIVDSVDGKFDNEGGKLVFEDGSRKETEAYLVLGRPKRTIQVATDLTGHPPMPPKWALGFMNSQWGSTEDEVRSLIATYRQKQIPIDAFILDFDFKAWGEDNFGEWRWNSTNGPGNVAPMKYPDGASGKFGKDMLSHGIHLVGIMKPRILVENTAGKPTVAAAEVTAHNWWLPGEKPYKDYFSTRPAEDLNFADPELRAWYWKHAKNLFDSGISAWWNDEADFGFPSLGFLHMQQSLYEGQRKASDRRVWSINRNFYLGAQRFAFGTWSGDIQTGFSSMQEQRVRMLATLDLGQPHWSMDSGGFIGHPSPENYARWIEFAATVPIMRVHGDYQEKRQPWVYGPVAEAAAKKAIEFRYSLFPYLYSLEHDCEATGVGIDRPLFWEFPADPGSANVTDEWMMGSSLLVSPIVEEGQTAKRIYLPPGRWFGLLDSKGYAGGQTVPVDCDSVTWGDLPVFVRSGSIIATQPILQYTEEKPVRTISLNVWPDKNDEGQFTVYDDDGETVRYESGDYFSQKITCSGSEILFGRPQGSYRTPIANYAVVIHGPFTAASWNGKPVQVTSTSNGIELTIGAGEAGSLRLAGQ